MSLTVGITYNLKADCPSTSLAEDWAAEYDENATVDAIVQALQALGHQVVLFPYQPDLVERLRHSRPDIVFNIAEGWSGRNRESVVPAILEFLNLPYTGSGPLTLGLAMDKAVCKQVVAATGVPVPPSWVIRHLAKPAQLSAVPLPAFVKPVCEGSSKGVRWTSRVTSLEELDRQVAWVLQNYQVPALVEPFLAGREFTVGVLGTDNPIALPVAEVLPKSQIASSDFVYSYDTKVHDLEEIVCPALVEADLQQRLVDIALRAHLALECRDVSRVDIRLDASGAPFFLEVNPLPGLAANSLLPTQARTAGLDFTQLVGAILDSACRRCSITAHTGTTVFAG